MADMFLKLDGVAGEALDDAHVGEIQIHEWTWDLTNDATYAIAASDASSHTKVNKVKIDKLYDRASVILTKFCALGKHIPTATITCRKNNGDQKVEYLIIVLREVMIHTVKWTGRGEYLTIPEEVELSFLKFELNYRTQMATGVLDAPVTFRFDVPTHTEY